MSAMCNKEVEGALSGWSEGLGGRARRYDDGWYSLEASGLDGVEWEGDGSLLNVMRVEVSSNAGRSLKNRESVQRE